jgi:hypothetical protein
MSLVVIAYRADQLHPRRSTSPARITSPAPTNFTRADQHRPRGSTSLLWDG